MRRRTVAIICLSLAVTSLLSWSFASRWAVDWWLGPVRTAQIVDCRDFQEVPSPGFWCTADVDGSSHRVIGAESDDVGRSVDIVLTTHWPARQGVPAVRPRAFDWTLLVALPALATILVIVACALLIRARTRPELFK